MCRGAPMSDFVVVPVDKLVDIVREAVVDALGSLRVGIPEARTYLTEDQAADYIGVKANTLRNWRVQKRGPAYLKGTGSVRYARKDLDAWLAASRTLTAESALGRPEMPC